MGILGTLRNLLSGKGRDAARGSQSTPTYKAPTSTTTGSSLKREDRPVKPAVIDDQFFRLGDYFGLHARSPNGRWVLSWMDSDKSGHRGGQRESGNGTYLLYDAEAQRAVVRGEMARPNNGKVADNGSFCLEDWHFGSSLSGTLHVFDVHGKSLIAKDVTANIVMSQISRDGRFALFQTANSPTDDGYKLFLLDVSQKTLRYSVEPLAGWPERYEIEDDTGEVIAHIKDLGSFRYGIEGTFIDAEKIARAQRESPRYEFAIPAAEELLKSPELTPETARQALDIVTRARKHGADQVDAWKAKSLKLQGLAHEALGELRSAVDAFDEALALDPKIGVKRKRDSLFKKLG